MRKFVPGIYSLSDWIVKHDDTKQPLRQDGELWGLLPPLSITSRGRVIAGCSGMDSQISVPMATIFAVVRAVSNRRRAKAWPLWCWITCAEEGLENSTDPASGGKHPPTHRRTHAQETHTRCCLLLRRNLSMAVIKKKATSKPRTYTLPNVPRQHGPLSRCVSIHRHVHLHPEH